jgi:uncharacterized protein YqeY
MITDGPYAETRELFVGFYLFAADAETTRAWVRKWIAASSASEPGGVGRVMGTLMKAHKGEVDGSLAKQMAAEMLAG